MQDEAVPDQRGPALTELDTSGRRRTYWHGEAPDVEGEHWYFDTVLDDAGRWIAVRQLTVKADGTRETYSVDHLEDAAGFLTDVPIDPVGWSLRERHPNEWLEVWRTSSTAGLNPAIRDRQTREMPTDCYACTQAAPDAPFRERFIREGGWRVAHDFNSSLEGWLILAPLRHVQSLDELTADEAENLGQLLRQGAIALKSVTQCVKTYVMLFAEAEGFAHLHVHLVPRMANQPDDRRGPRAFGYLKDDQPVAQERRDDIAEALRQAWPN